MVNIKKIITFILRSYKPWTIKLAFFILFFALTFSAMSTHNQKSVIQEQIDSKKVELFKAEKNAEDNYKQALFLYEKCNEEKRSQPTRLRFCYYPSIAQQIPKELKVELDELVGISNKSWGRLFIENVLLKNNNDDVLPPIYFLLIFVFAVPLFGFLIVLYKISVKALKFSINKSCMTSGEVCREVKKLPVFQRYLIILLSLITVMFAVAIILRIF